MQFLETLSDLMVVQISNYLGAQPMYVMAVSIIIISAFVAKASSFIFANIILALTAKTKSDIDDKIIGVVKSPVSDTIFILGIALFVRYITGSVTLIRYSDNLLLTMLTVFWSIAAIRIVHIIFSDIAGHLTRKTKTTMDEEFLPLFENLGKIIVVSVAFLGILKIWNVDITPLLASAGIAGFAIAFAAKDTVANFFGGISIYLDKPYRLGDYIILDSGERGEVKDIGVRSTRIITRDNILLTIPNSAMANAKITNESAPRRKMRLRLNVGVSYKSDLDKVEKILLKLAYRHKEVVDKPSARVRFKEFGNNAIKCELRFWIEHPEVKGRLTSEIIKEIHKTFRKEKIEIPFPQMDVHLTK